MARFLVMAGALIDDNPSLAYEHAKAAYRRAARIDIVREALGLTSYANEKYGEALRELRTYRRMSGDLTHISLEADCERGMGRPERAIRYLEDIDLQQLSADAQIELALVLSGAYSDMGKPETGLALIDTLKVDTFSEPLRARVEIVRCARLREVGRDDEAEQIEEQWRPIWEAESVEVFDEDIEEDEFDAGYGDDEMTDAEWVVEDEAGGSDEADSSDASASSRFGEEDADAETDVATDDAADIETESAAEVETAEPAETEAAAGENESAKDEGSVHEPAEEPISNEAPAEEQTDPIEEPAASDDDPDGEAAPEAADLEAVSPEAVSPEAESLPEESETEEAPVPAADAVVETDADQPAADETVETDAEPSDDELADDVPAGKDAESDEPAHLSAEASADGTDEPIEPAEGETAPEGDEQVADEPMLFDLSDAGMYEDDDQ